MLFHHSQAHGWTGKRSPRRQTQLGQTSTAEEGAGGIGAERGGVVPSGFALGNGGGGVGEKRNCLGRDEVSLKLPDCGSWDDTTLGACRPESSVSL